MLELIHTSAIHGLKPNTSGFCSVAWTEGLPVNYIDLLEQMSGYKVLFSPHEVEAKNNPIAYAFMYRTIGNKRIPVLSRLAPDGLDYTSRVNKIAHHIILSEEELKTYKPATLCLTENLFIKHFQGTPHLLPYRKAFANPIKTGSETWESLAGDVRWAKWIASRFLTHPKDVVYVIFRPGINVIGLVEEVMEHLSFEEAAHFSFHTFFMQLPPGVDCFLRFCLPDCSELHLVQRQKNCCIIDLCTPGKNTLPTHIEIPSIQPPHLNAHILPMLEKTTAQAFVPDISINTPFNIEHEMEFRTIKRRRMPLIVFCIIFALITTGLALFFFFEGKFSPLDVTQKLENLSPINHKKEPCKNTDSAPKSVLESVDEMMPLLEIKND